MYKDSESPAKDFTKKPLPGTTASKPPAPKTPHAKPRAEGESDEAYNKRTANFAKSQERLKSVGITGGVNNASKDQLKSFSDKYGHGPSGLKPQEDKSKEPKDTTKPDMSAENPAKSKTKDPFTKRQSDELKAPGTPVKKDIIKDAAQKQMSSIPGNARRARRKKRLIKKASMQGGTY